MGLISSAVELISFANRSKVDDGCPHKKKGAKRIIKRTTNVCGSTKKKCLVVFIKKIKKNDGVLFSLGWVDFFSIFLQKYVLFYVKKRKGRTLTDID